MPQTLMLILCVCCVAVLLHIERKNNPDASIALWIPTIYMLILGSRPIAHWFVESTVSFQSSDPEAGSLLDMSVLIILLLFTLLVLFRRKMEWSDILKNNSILLILYVYLGISVLWSDHTFLSIKRWIRLTEAIPIAMVVMSECSPLVALESVFRRCAYVLVPFSLILAKYYPHLGAQYGRWSGILAWNGVTLGKNALAHLCLVTSIFIIWSFFKDKKNVLNSTLKTLVDGFILVIAVYLLFGGPGGFSATSTTNFIVVIISLLLLYRMKNKAKQIATFLSFTAVLLWIILIFSESFVSTVTPLLGRNPTFTDRTDIWAMALRDAAQNPILGTGFGSYFATDNEFSRTFGYTGHNGLLDVYVELGVLGVILVLVFLFSVYKKFHNEFNHSFNWGVFATCLLVISIIANFTESLFLKSSSYIWNSMILLTIVFTAPKLNREKDIYIKHDIFL